MRKVRRLVQPGFPLAGKQFLSFYPREIALAMGENDWIDAFPATHATKVDRPDFEDLFRDHEASAAMAAISTYDCLLATVLGMINLLLPDTRRPGGKGFSGRICVPPFAQTDVERGNSPIGATAP